MAQKKNQAKPSVVFSSLVVFGMLLAVIGAVVLVLGLGGGGEFSGKIGTIEFKTTSVGLAMVAIGSLLSGLVATNLPKGVTVFGTQEASWLDKVARRAAILIAIGVVAAGVLVANWMWR